MFAKTIILPEQDLLDGAKPKDGMLGTMRGNAEALQRRQRLLLPGKEVVPVIAQGKVAGELAGSSSKGRKARALRAAASSPVTGSAAASVAESAEPAHSQPNGAVQIGFDTVYTDSITGVGKRRWYYFQVAERKKVTVYVSGCSDHTVDNDLSLYSLDTSTGQLSQLAISQNKAGMYELLSHIAEAGIYFVCVAAYAGAATNSYQLMAHLSDTWDDFEGDDNLQQLKLQPLNTPVKHTIDNQIDQDFSVLQLPEGGEYAFCLMGVPTDCEYVLDVMDLNYNNIVDPIAGNGYQKKKLPAGQYILRLSAYGKFDPSAMVSVLATNIPASASDYRAILSTDKKHFVEVMAFAKDAAGKSLHSVAIDGASLSYREIELKTTRENTQYSTGECSISTTKNTAAIGVAVGKYTGPMHCENALLITLDSAIYAETHWRKTYSPGDVANATKVNSGTDSNGRRYYTAFWNFVGTLFRMNLIFDMDAKEFVDFREPNWYYGDASRARYPRYSGVKPGFFIPSGWMGDIEEGNMFDVP